MTRKSLAAAIILILSIAAPAAAVIGFCAKMPCCSHASGSTGATVDADSADCCTTINCYEGPSPDLATGTSITYVTAPVVVVTATVAAMNITPPHGPDFHDSSPPRSNAERLSALSILLI